MHASRLVNIPSVLSTASTLCAEGAVHTTQCPEVGVRGRAIFESNRVAGSGGGFYGGSCDKVTLDNAVFRSNDATWGGEGTPGLP